MLNKVKKLKGCRIERKAPDALWLQGLVEIAGTKPEESTTDDSPNLHFSLLNYNV